MSSSLSAFYERGMSVYEPRTDHLCTKNEFARAMDILFRVGDENGVRLERDSERLIEIYSKKWFLLKATLTHFHLPHIPRVMKNQKLSIASCCRSLGKEKLAQRYEEEAQNEFENFKFPNIECSALAHQSPETEEDSKMEVDQSSSSNTSSGRATSESLGIPGSSGSANTSNSEPVSVVRYGAQDWHGSSDSMVEGQVLPEELDLDTLPSISKLFVPQTREAGHLLSVMPEEDDSIGSL